MKLTFGGSVNYKSYITKYLSSSITILDDNDFLQADIIYWIFGPGPDLVRFFFKWFNPRVIIIIHWIGSDVLYIKEKVNVVNLRKNAYYKLWLFVNKWKARQKRVFHFASAEWLVAELAEIGLDSTYLPISSIDDALLSKEFSNVSKTYDFYAYFPYHSPEIYNGALILEIADRMSEFKFVFVHPDLNECDIQKLNYPANVKALPRQTHDEILDLFKQTKCLLRFTKHDSLSLGVLEALASQMQVLWTYNYPHVVTVVLSDIYVVEKTMRDTINNWHCNSEGKKYVSDNFNSVKIRSLYDKSLNNKLG